MTPEFSGNPRRYRRIAVAGTAGMFLWIYGIFAGVQYFAYGQTWPLGWKPLAVVVVVGIWFARFYYRSMMRLDAQYGSGRGWQLVERTVKLPELRAPGAKRRPEP